MATFVQEPPPRDGWEKSRHVSWTWIHPATGAVVYLRNMLVGGYWLAMHPNSRPYAWCDGILRGRRGRPRRFKTAEAAMLAAENVATEDGE